MKSLSPTMSGRGGRPSYRGGRGKGKASSKPQSKAGKPSEPKKEARKGLSDYIFTVGGAKQATNFTLVEQFIINHIRKTYQGGDDLGNALENRQETDFLAMRPILAAPTALPDNRAEFACQTRENELYYEAQVKEFVSRVNRYEDNKGRAFALIFSQCDKTLQNKILSLADYEAAVKGNPIEMLVRIQQLSIQFQEKKYGTAVVVDAMKNLLNLKQTEDEDLVDYTRRFKSARDILESQWGSKIAFPKLSREDEAWDDNDAARQAQAKTNSYNKFLAYLYVENADRLKYGDFFEQLGQQYALNHDQFPKTLYDATSILSNRKFSPKYYETKKARKEKQRKEQEKASKSNAASNQEQRDTQAPQLSFAQMEGKCYCCGKAGHKSDKCRNKHKPKSEWAINKAPEVSQLMAQLAQTQTSSGSNQSDEAASIATAPAQLEQSQQPSSGQGQAQYPWALILQYEQGYNMTQVDPSLRKMIILDSGSSVDHMCNEAYVSNIQEADSVLHLTTTGGSATTTRKGDFKFIKDYITWFDPAGISNVLGLANLMKRYRVTLDSDKEPAFLVHTERGVVRFSLTANNLFAYIPPDSTTQFTGVDPKTKAQFVETVAKNEAVHTPRDVERAKAAMRLLHSVGFPSFPALKHALTANSIKDCPVLPAHVDLAQKIYGKDVASIKGKTTRRKPTAVENTTITIPPELLQAQQSVDLCMDALFVEKMPFLSTVSKRIIYRTCGFVPSKKVQSYREALAEVLQLYLRAGLSVDRIHADNEFKPLLEEMRDEYHFHPNYASAEEHVPEAERNNRSIKERFRSVVHSTPFTALPKVVIKIIMTEVAAKLNYFPVKAGCSEVFSPRMILHQVPLDYTRHCKTPMLTYCLAHDEPTPSNTMVARALDSLYLRSTGSHQGGYQFYHLATGSIITRRNFTPLPMNDQVIKAVNAAAANDGIRSMKVRTRRQYLHQYHQAWLTGVGRPSSKANTIAIHDENDDSDYDTPSDIEDSELDDDYYSDKAEDEEASLDQGEINHQDPEGLSQPGSLQDPQVTDEDEQSQSDESVAEEQPQPPRRSARAQRAPEWHSDYVMHQVERAEPTDEYTLAEAKVMAMIMTQINERLETKSSTLGNQHLVPYSLKKGIQKFGEKGRRAALKEMKQLHDRKAFQPVHKSSLKQTEKSRALESLIFLTEKRDGTIKARHCANGSTQRSYMARESVSSPTVATESTLLTAVIEAEEGRDVATCDIPNAFIQTDVERQDSEGNRIIMKIRGALVDILCEMDPSYKDYVVQEGNQSVLYMHIIKAIYGLLVSAMLFYKKLAADLTKFGFEINPYDPCVANKMIHGKQMTVSWHVDDLKISHGDNPAVTSFLKWVTDTYGKIGEVKVTRGKIHEYLGIKLDYSVPGQVTVDMVDYIQSMLNSFPEEDLKGSKVSTPWGENLFKVQEDSNPLPRAQAEQFHTTVAQGLFACKRGRPDISPAIAYLTTRVKSPNESDWGKLVRMMKFLKQTQGDKLTLRSDRSGQLKWHVDASFAVHPDFRSHTGATFSMGEGAISTLSRKQGMNTRSSTEAEVVAADEAVGPMLWTKLFLESQGYPVRDNILFQDNHSAMLLESNGRKSAGKRSRHLNIRFFFVTDQKDKGNISIKYCPTDDMVGDYMTKPLHGKKFAVFRQKIMNLPMAAQLFMAAYVVE